MNPQSLNRYSYVLNNPLKYTDPSGNWPDWLNQTISWAQQQVINGITTVNEFWNDIAAVAEPAIEIGATGVAIYSCFRGNTGLLQQRAMIAGTIEQRAANAIAKGGSKAPSLAENVLPKLEGPGVAATEKVASKALVPYYPSNGGALGAWEKATLSPGSTFSRIGDIRGHYASLGGTPLEMRSLPPSRIGEPLTDYRVVKALEVEKSTVAPWWGQLGLGTQYRLPQSIQSLLANKYIEPMP